MPGNYRREFRRQLPFDHVQIRAAHAAHLYAHKHFARARHWRLEFSVL
jgi:hypothetical protein